VGQAAVTEGGRNLYQITPLPPGMILCVNAAGATVILNRDRSTIWSYVKAGRLRSFNVAGNAVIPIADIAGMLGVTANQIYNVGVGYRLPMWQIYPEEV